MTLPELRIRIGLCVPHDRRWRSVRWFCAQMPAGTSRYKVMAVLEVMAEEGVMLTRGGLWQWGRA